MTHEWFSHIDRRRLESTFCALAAVDSPSRGERLMADKVKALFEELGFALSEDNAGEALGGSAGNLFLRIPGDESCPPVLFGAHLDTVEPACGKRAAVDENGVITSAGETVLGADDLSAVAELYEAARIWKENGVPHRPVEIAFFAAEELYTLGSRVFDFSAVRAKEAYVLDLSGQIGRAALRAPAFLYYKAVVHGKASHAGFAPEAGISAVKAAAEAVSRIPIGHTDADTTVAVGIMNGGLATNIVPEMCTVEGEIRSYFDEKAYAALEKVKKCFGQACARYGAGLDFEVEKRAAAYHFAPDAPIVGRFSEACRFCGLEPQLVETFGGSDANTCAERGIPSLVVANGMHRIHTTDEFTTLDDMEAACRLILALAAPTLSPSMQGKASFGSPKSI